MGCVKLRGGVEPARYKDYVLKLLFVKYVSDRFKSNDMWDIEVLQGGSFDDIIKLKGTTNIGDAYEYLMQNYAKNSGKSKGQFYTPAEVSRIIAQIIGLDQATGTDKTLYDPACGSGSLLIRAADAALKKVDGTLNVAIYGQEITKETAGLARMNFVLHNMAAAEVAGNKSTLANPQFKDERHPNLLRTFDYIVMNPPFSYKSWMDELNITVKGDVATESFGRFDGYKVPPEKNVDYAWFLHVLRSLKSTGKAAIILPHGVLFRGNSEADIRKEIIDRGYIKGIIGLPANLFFGTGIPACIILIDKEDAPERQDIFMIDASKGYIKDGNKNRLREQDIHKIVTVFNGQLELDKYSRFVSKLESKVNMVLFETPEYQAALKKRQIWSEGTFAAQKWGHNLMRILRRGLEAAEDHCLLSATALNLKRMIRCTG